MAILSNIAFNSASKRHRPTLRIGQAVICHVSYVNKFLETEVSCEDPTSQKDWVTNEVYFGGLADGGLFLDLPVIMGPRLNACNCPLFKLIGAHLKPFEVAIGVNGRIYILADSARAVAISRILQKSSNLCLAEIEDLCSEFAHSLK